MRHTHVFLAAPNTQVPNSCLWCIVVLWQESRGSPEAADAAEAQQYINGRGLHLCSVYTPTQAHMSQ